MGTATHAENAYAYSASKAAVHHLTRILAQEFAGRQVTVNAIAPGQFPTNMTRFAIGDEAGAARGAKTVPMGRLGREDDIAGAILFLTGRGGAYTTGAILPVDGGLGVAPPPSMFGGRGIEPLGGRQEGSCGRASGHGRPQLGLVLADRRSVASRAPSPRSPKTSSSSMSIPSGRARPRSAARSPTASSPSRCCRPWPIARCPKSRARFMG